MNRLPASSRGAAIILAMLVAALAAAVAVTLITDETRWMMSTEARRDYAQAKTLAAAGVQWARHVLYEDQRQNEIDHLRESWAFPLPPTPIENGSIEGQIIDLQGKININNLRPSSSLRRAERARLLRLAKTLNIDEAALSAVFLRFTDPRESDGLLIENRQTRQKRLSDSRVPALFDAGELGDLPGFPDAALRKFAPHIIALPASTPLNINTAGRETLKASLPGISDDELAKLITLRTAKPFHSISDFSKALPETAKEIEESALSVQSRFFLITVRVQQGNARSEAQALLRREEDRWPVVVWKTVE